MSAINKRSTRKRAAVAYAVQSSESEDEPSSSKKQKYVDFFIAFIIRTFSHSYHIYFIDFIINVTSKCI